jgi:DNA-binding ferritin-like protein (Dps family)
MEAEKLNFNIRLAIRHSLRVLYARGKMQDFFPLTTLSEYQNLSDEQIEHIDQLVYRFQKLQDDMGSKLFKSVVANLGETEVFNKPILEILNTLKKYGVINESVNWQTMREIRNSLAHEYLDDIESDRALLNYLFETKSLELIQIFKDILDYIQTNLYSNLHEGTKIEINRFYETLAKSDFSDS